MGILDGKVAIVTGAGHGIGRGHAMELARHGAQVLVNDLGSSVTGQGAGRDADLTVNLMTDRGGVAVANYEDVADFAEAERMIRQAVDQFGRLDILVNNAGIVRDSKISSPLVAWLASDEAAHVTGQVLRAIGETIVLLDGRRYGPTISSGEQHWDAERLGAQIATDVFRSRAPGLRPG